MFLLRKFLFGLLFCLWSSLALAGVNCTIDTFLPNTLADANAVNAAFTEVKNCLLNAALAGNNNDITALLALTAPIPAAQGGSMQFLGGTSAGTNTLTVTTSQPLSGFTLTRGVSVMFTAGLTNTGATTLAVNGTAATNLFRQSPAGPQALTGGEIVAGDLVWAVYDGTQFQLVNSGAQYGGFGPLTTLSSAAPDLGTIPSHNITFTGNTAITSFGSSASVTFPVYRLNFATVLTLTHNGTSLILPSATNITTASGDNAVALYLGGGNWQVTQYNKANGTSVVSPTPRCGFNALSVTTVSDTQINWAFNNSNLLTTGNVPIYSGAKSGSITITTGTGGTSTAGGMDGTAPSANAFLYMYAITNGSVWNAVASNTVPSSFTNLPAGYSYSCYMGAMKAKDATHVYGTQILGNEAQYVNGGSGGAGSLTSLPVLASGVQGGAPNACTTATPTWASITVRGSSGVGIWFPTTSVISKLVVVGSIGGTPNGVVSVAPNANYIAAGSNPSPFHLDAAAANVALTGDLLFEGGSNAIFMCSTGAGSGVLARGWKDAVNAN